MSSRDEARLFDVRTLERNLRKGLVSKKDLERYMKGLSDAADKATACNPEAQGREAPHPVSHRAAAVVAAPGPLDDEGDDLIDEEGVALDDDEDDDDDDEDADEPAAEEE